MRLNHQLLALLSAGLFLVAMPALGQSTVTETETETETVTENEAGTATVTETETVTVAEGGSSRGDRYPKLYVERPLTLANNMIRIDGAVRIDHVPGSTDAAFVLGGAISFAKILELGLSPERLGMLSAPSVEGALPLKFLNPVELGSLPIYFRFRALEKKKADLAVDVGVSIPLESNPNVSTFAAVLSRIRLHERVILDTGADIRIEFLSKSSSNEKLTIPVIFSFQIVDAFYGTVRTGFTVLNFEKQGVAVPLGWEIGYTVKGSDGPMVDFVARFEWTQLWRPGAVGGSTSDVNVWFIGLGGRFYIPFGA